ncbi:hypothetical protein NET02_06565 [Thermomicrobiaceae bacterium CFH 74404]|uniref:Uncharacterized protein n=1 Tax=Thermalbibacter longus TaxID=2951981 RepID=A0AA41WA16_9BACT|nr:hypothetical protein [Thermalbibacter longus]MCM8748804.1 hypothetical protein [Thermalbibacter longus]
MRAHSDPQVQVVSEAEIRRLFNTLRYWERVQNGELRAEVIRESHVTSLTHTEHCSMSQTLRYYGHDGTKIAIVHQYRRRDGTIGASGHPDPKWLRVGDIVYVPQPPASSP